MHYLFTSSLTIDDVMEKEPPYHYFNELLATPIQYHLLWLFLLLCTVISLWLVNKFDTDESAIDEIRRIVMSIALAIGVVFGMYSLFYFIVPTSKEDRLSQEWIEWKEDYVIPYIEKLPTQTTTNINKKEINNTIGGHYNADIVFSVDGELVNESRVEIIPKGSEYLVSYKYLEEDLPGYEKGYFDVKLIVPEDVQIE